jgi:hygromycin-B 4-O-kinase
MNMEKVNLTKRQVRAVITSAMGDGLRDLSPIDQGAWSSTYAFRLGEGEYIVRFSPLDEDFRRDQFACRFSSPQIPVPKIVEIGEAFGGYYAISEQAPGVAIDLLAAEEVQEVVPAVLRLLDALRQADVSSTHGFGGWEVDGNGTFESWKDSLLAINTDHPDGRISGWREKLAASSYGTKRFDRFYAQFAVTLEDCPEARHLVHADLLHFNLLVDQGKITAVLDWGCAKYGDFLYDLAWFTFWAPWFPAMQGIDWRELSRRYYAERGIAIPDFDRRLAAYELHIGLDSLAYCAFIERWGMVEVVLQQMGEILK